MDYDFMDTEDYDDYYDDDDDWPDIDQSPFAPTMSLTEVFENCVKPALSESSTLIFHLFLCALIQRILLRFFPARLTVLYSICAGVWLLYKHVSPLATVIVVLYLLSSVSILFISTSIGSLRLKSPLLLVGFSAAAMIGCQSLLPPVLFTKVRGALMLAIMKVCSIGWDKHNSVIQTHLHPVTVTAYLLEPSTVIFGPWYSYEKFRSAFGNQTESIKDDVFQIFHGIFLLFIAVLLLLYAHCFAMWLIPDYMEHYSIWIVSYRDAQSFRFSHYFVSIMSQALIIISGISSSSDSIVSRPLSIEIPRSLVDVVVSWNIPMHNWLKLYVFRPSKPLGNFFAVLLTYIASSGLHGLNFQLSAVLLSLGVYTYAEHVLRNKLSTVYNACVQARPCSQCTHTYTKKNVIIMVVNFAFSALAVFHLAYLGMVFDGSEAQETGYSWTHTLVKWQSLNYASHIVGAVTLFFAKAV